MKKKNFMGFLGTPGPIWKSKGEPLESIIVALAKSMLMQVGHQNMEQESTKKTDYDDQIDIYCRECDEITELTYSEAYFWNLGLLPLRCEGCGELHYNTSIKELRKYMEGKDEKTQDPTKTET